jgi:hypothetical protein
MEQETQNLPDSRVWDNRATEVIAEARKMRWEIGDARRLEKRDVCALPPRLTDGWQLNRGTRVVQAAMLGLAMTVMSQRLGLLDLTSMTERTNPVTGDPSTVTVVFWPRC